MQQREAGLIGSVVKTGFGATVGMAIALQWAVILVVAGIASAWGWSAAWSLILGGAAVAVPNAALALWLVLRLRAGTSGVVALMAGELLKLGLTLALLTALVAKWKTDVSWLPLIVGVIAALKAQWLALWLTRNYQ